MTRVKPNKFVNKATASEADARIVIDDLLRKAGWDPRDKSQARTHVSAVFVVHSILVFLKQNQRGEKTKRHTVLNLERKFDEEEQLAGIVHRTPAWTDTFHQHGRKDSPLRQIVDVPFFTDTKPVLLIQIDGLIVYCLRAFAEAAPESLTEAYVGEVTTLSGWAATIAEIALPTSTRFPSKGQCSTSQLFREQAS